MARTSFKSYTTDTPLELFMTAGSRQAATSLTTNGIKVFENGTFEAQGGLGGLEVHNEVAKAIRDANGQEARVVRLLMQSRNLRIIEFASAKDARSEAKKQGNLSLRYDVMKIGDRHIVLNDSALQSLTDLTNVQGVSLHHTEEDLIGSERRIKFDTRKNDDELRFSSQLEETRKQYGEILTTSANADIRRIAQEAIAYATDLYTEGAVGRGVSQGMAAKAAAGLDFSLVGNYLTIRNSGAYSHLALFIEYGTKPANALDFINHARRRRIAKTSIIKSKKGNRYYFSGDVPKNSQMQVIVKPGRPYLIVGMQEDTSEMADADLNRIPNRTFIGEEFISEGVQRSLRMNKDGSISVGRETKTQSRDAFDASSMAIGPMTNNDDANPRELERGLQYNRDAYVADPQRQLYGGAAQAVKAAQFRAQARLDGNNPLPLRSYTKGAKRYFRFATLSPGSAPQTPIRMPGPVPAFPVMQKTQVFIEQRLRALVDSMKASR